ncbi:MAG: hypothetical protein HWN67_14570 [Candidatus Helarchaeota archaeon]|nr:hypothetical protein [Candidatus Helarchaeota archaeon]
MKLKYNQKVYLITIIYAICTLPLYFLLFKIPNPVVQPWQVLIFPLLLPICLILPKKIKNKIIECNDFQLTLVDNQKFKGLYAEDTRAWMERTYKRKRDKLFNLTLLIVFLILPSVLTFYLLQNVQINLTFLEWIYFIGFGITLIAILIYAGYNFFLLLQVSSIIHHFCFWETKGISYFKNPLGELLILNIFTFTCLYSVLLNYLTPLLFGIIVFTVSGVNPKIDYVQDVGPEFSNYKKITPYILIFANLMYLIKWAHGFYSNTDLLLFSSNFLVFFIYRHYLNDVLTARYSDYEKATADFLETFAHDKIQVPYYALIIFASLIPFIFAILTASLWSWKFALFIIFTIFSFISSYIGISFLSYEKNRAILQKFRKLFLSVIIMNSCIPLGFYVVDTFIFLSVIQFWLLPIVIILTILNLIFGHQFYNREVNDRFRLFFCFSIICVSLIPLLNFVIEFIFTQSLNQIFWNLWLTLLLTALGVVLMFLGIHLLRRKTKEIVSRFLPYIPEHKIEETNFHFWASFNSNHSFYFSIFFGFTFLFFGFGWSLINLFEIQIIFNDVHLFTIDLLGYNLNLSQITWFFNNYLGILIYGIGVGLTVNIFGINININQIIWIFGNYLGIFVYGLGIGFLFWLLFNATHDVWHSITLSEGVPIDVHKDLYSKKKIFFQGALLVILICGGIAIWYLGDILIRTSYFQILYRFSNLLVMGIITFLGIIYIIRHEINRKKQNIK